MITFIRQRQSLLIAFTVAAVLAGWLLSGPGLGGARPEAPASAPAAAEAPVRVTGPRKVRVRTIAATAVSRNVVVNGRTEATRAVTLRSETDGRVVEIGAERGARVSKGDLIVRLDERDLAARLAEALALVAQREIEFEAVKRLKASKFQSATALAQAKAQLESARAATRRVRTAMARTRIVAPFDGLLDERPIEVGDYLNDGNQVARLLDVQPMIVTGDVTQLERDYLSLGAEGIARLITGEEVTGSIRYISAESELATRTFRIELEVPNPDGTLVAGVTAEIEIPAETVSAHRLSPALLSLDDADRIGVKLVDATDTVRFRGIEIVRADAEGIWVSGLPDPARIITVGHGFVRDGDAVEPVEPE